TEQEVLEFQQTWGDGIVRIGEMPTWQQAEIAAQEHIRQLYDYQREPVLFRPTLAYPDQFRTDSVSALSYFVGRNPDYPLDDGFALAPYSNVSWKNVGINITGNVAVAMGNYYFTYAGDDSILEVEYSFAYSKDQDGKLKIILQGSHLPYTPEEIEKIEEIKARSHKTYQ
ncbi:MAG: hypothetical protein JKY54_06545, partial [Flavobacteriales bacterium]|nr:hypothetical protein [Flavobacteriales bacterium]